MDVLLHSLSVCEFETYLKNCICRKCDFCFLYHPQRRTTVVRTPLDEWSSRCRDLYLTTHNNLNRQTSMPPVGFEPTISAGEWLQTQALDRTTIGLGILELR